MTKKLIERIIEKRHQLQQLQEHDGDKISALRKSIVGDEATLADVKRLGSVVAQFEPAVGRLRAEIERREVKCRRLRHLAAHACISGAPTGRYINGLAALEISPEIVQGIEAEIRKLAVTQPEQELARIAAEFAVQPPTTPATKPQTDTP